VTETDPEAVADALVGADAIRAVIRDLMSRYPQPVLKDVSIAILGQLARYSTSVSAVEAAAVFAGAIIAGALEPRDWEAVLEALPGQFEKNRVLLKQLGGREGPPSA
jgi:hypothetical protein